jgi:transcriptional regulator with XRE-family HTH domain
VAQRRTELKLSREQVAARAKLNVRYLEYLERYPASPTTADLRNLAAALMTTPSALRGAGLDAPPGRHLTSSREFKRLTLAECRTLIAPGGVGRIAFGARSGTVVLPVNFAVVTGTIVLRTSA